MVLFQTGNPLRKKDGLHKYIVRLNYTDRNVQYKRIERTVYGKDAAKNMELQLMESVKKRAFPCIKDDSLSYHDRARPASPSL